MNEVAKPVSPAIKEPSLEQLNAWEARCMDFADELAEFATTHPHTACERSVSQAHAGACSMLAWIRHAKDGRGKILECGNGKVRRTEPKRRG